MEEVEQAALGETRAVDWEVVDGEERYHDLAATSQGRVLKIITTERNGMSRVVTAFDASLSERKLYLQELRKTYG